jgi:hypothetical protein
MADVFPPDRPNPPDLVPFAEARAGVLERLRPLPVREVGLGDALGSVLAADVAADHRQGRGGLLGGRLLDPVGQPDQPRLDLVGRGATADGAVL